MLSHKTGRAQAGTLYLVPTLLGPAQVAMSLPQAVVRLVHELDGFIAENAKSARQFLKALDHPVPLRDVSIVELNEHTPVSAFPGLLAPVYAGKRIGLLSEAGCPAVADPGAGLIALAHRDGLRVVPLVGPSSLLLALMASGLNGQNFCFHGYLPTERGARTGAIRRIEAESLASGACQLFIEAPYRNNHLLAALLETCTPATRLCLATELTLPGESVRTQRIDAWRSTPPDLDRRPTVFLLQAVPQDR
jgi:16S rRNA (cytidine1402-2'-O)-methyltransferase